jgi:hypothetical protein
MVGGTDHVVSVAVTLRNRGSVPVFVGGPDVSPDWGYQLDPGEGLSIDLDARDDGVWAVTASGSSAVHRLQRGI